MGEVEADLGLCVIHSRSDATFPNCPLWSPRATELSHYNGDEWEATGEKRQKGGVVVMATGTSTLHPSFSLLLSHTKTHLRRHEAQTGHVAGNDSDWTLKTFLPGLSF